MNKEQFLARLRQRLDGLPEDAAQPSLDYYREMIEDRMEDGLSEEEAVEAMGTPDDAAGQIWMAAPLPALRKTSARRRSRGWKAWEIALLVLGSPVWAPLLAAGAAVVLALYIVCWSLILVLYAVDLSFAAGALAGVASSVPLWFTGGTAAALCLLGGGLACAGLAVPLFLVCPAVTRRFARGSARCLKTLFFGRRRSR